MELAGNERWIIATLSISRSRRVPRTHSHPCRLRLRSRIAQLPRPGRMRDQEEPLRLKVSLRGGPGACRRRCGAGRGGGGGAGGGGGGGAGRAGAELRGVEASAARGAGAGDAFFAMAPTRSVRQAFMDCGTMTGRPRPCRTTWRRGGRACTHAGCVDGQTARYYAFLWAGGQSNLRPPSSPSPLTKA